jgi:hypothetical protein
VSNRVTNCVTTGTHDPVRRRTLGDPLPRPRGPRRHVDRRRSFADTEEVTGSIPVSPTKQNRSSQAGSPNKGPAFRSLRTPVWSEFGADLAASLGDPRTPRRGVDAGAVEDVPHGAGRDPVAEADQFAMDAPVPPSRVVGGQVQHQFLICPAIGGRPGRACGYVRRRAIRSRCQRSSVPGVTKKIGQRARGSGRDSVASTTRSAGCSFGRCTWRRSTATWWRRTRSSTSLAPSSRAVCPPRRGNRKGVVEKANHAAAQRCWRTLGD